MSELTFEIPDENTPGFLRNAIKAAKFRKQLAEKKDMIEYYEGLIEFLLPHITEPEDRDEAREALLDCSKKQYMDLLNVAYGITVNPTSATETETS